MSATPGTALVLIRIVPHADEGLVLRHYVSSITHCHPAHCAHESSLIGLRSAAYQGFALSINNASNTHISDMVCCRFTSLLKRCSFEVFLSTHHGVGKRGASAPRLRWRDHPRAAGGRQLAADTVWG